MQNTIFISCLYGLISYLPNRTKTYKFTLIESGKIDHKNDLVGRQESSLRSKNDLCECTLSTTNFWIGLFIKSWSSNTWKNIDNLLLVTENYVAFSRVTFLHHQDFTISTIHMYVYSYQIQILKLKMTENARDLKQFWKHQFCVVLKKKMKRISVFIFHEVVKIWLLEQYNSFLVKNLNILGIRLIIKLKLWTFLSE